MSKQPRAPKAPRAITPELIRSALGHIPPDVDRDTWARVGMAIKDESPGEAGFNLFDEWSAQGQSYKAASVRETWRSIKAGGRTTIGTLFGIAKDYGFRFPEGDDVQTPAPDPVEAARLAEVKRKQREADEAQFRARADRAARDAVELWEQASEAGESAYLVRKGCGGHGVRFLPDGTLLVPMRDAAGKLQNVQRIAPAKPADGTDKRFLPGGRKTGMFHVLGALGGAAVGLVAEGYATAASLYEATGHPVAVAFDAGNLPHVCKALRGQFPALPLLICGDDDSGTEARTGSNPGKVKANSAAKAVNSTTGPAAAVFPVGLPEGGTDFNDLAGHAGADAVRACVEPAALALLDLLASAPGADVNPATAATSDPAPAAESASQEDTTAPDGEPARPARKPRTRKSGQGADDSGNGQDKGADDRPGFDCFRCDESGVWYTPPASDDGTTASARRVCDRLDVLALARDGNDNGGALLLEFDTVFTKARRWLMPLSTLAGDGAEYRRELLGMGFITPTDPNRRRWLTEYLQSRRPDDRIRMVDRVGWHGRSYVLPRETLRGPDASDGDEMMFHSDGPTENTFTQRGTPEQWREQIGRLCSGNSRLLFAASVALAGPVMGWVKGTESGGFHLRGDSSGGKTTALKVCASVWGGKNYLQRWRATDNGLEAIAVQHSDAVLVLDELGQLDARLAGESAYMLANGQGKIRGGRNGGARPTLTWRLLWLSSGEIPLAVIMAEAGKKIRAGQELRMVDVPADAGAGLGIFEALHQFSGGADLAEHLGKSCESTHGAVGRAWLEWLTANSGEWPRHLREHVDELAADFVSVAADGQVKRAGRRFALVAAAGELATHEGFTGWAPGEATAGVRACFLAWIAARPAGWGSSERAEAISQVRSWIQMNGDAMLTWFHRVNDDHRPNTAYRAGYRRFVNDNGEPVKYEAADEYTDARTKPGSESTADFLVEHLIFPDQFKSQVCKGLNAQFVADVLKDIGALKHDKGENTSTVRVPGIGKTRMFRILPSLFNEAE